MMSDSKKADSQLSKGADDVLAGPSATNVNTNEELDSLLDSALDDFDKPLPKVSKETAKAATVKQEQSSGGETGPTFTGDEFKQVRDAMESFLQEDPNLQAQFEQLTAGAASGDFSASLEEAMKLITDNAQSMPEPSPEELQQLFSNFGNMGLGNEQLGNGQMPEFMPLLQHIMQNLLSKDVLYPALKDIVAKYPSWLAENKQKITGKDYENYSQQYQLMTQICEEFESKNSSSDDGQTNSFEKILSLMQKMQECGNPPKDIMGDFSSSLPFDELNLKNGVMPEQCVVM